MFSNLNAPFLAMEDTLQVVIVRMTSFTIWVRVGDKVHQYYRSHPNNVSSTRQRKTNRHSLRLWDALGKMLVDL